MLTRSPVRPVPRGGMQRLPHDYQPSFVVTRITIFKTKIAFPGKQDASFIRKSRSDPKKNASFIRKSRADPKRTRVSSVRVVRIQKRTRVSFARAVRNDRNASFETKFVLPGKKDASFRRQSPPKRLGTRRADENRSGFGRRRRWAPFFFIDASIAASLTSSTRLDASMSLRSQPFPGDHAGPIHAPCISCLSSHEVVETTGVSQRYAPS